MELAALRILERTGIAVPDDDMRRRLASHGFAVSGERVRIPSAQVRKFLEAERQADGDGSARGSRPLESPDPAIQLSVSPYPQHVHDPCTDAVMPFDAERLIEATRLIHVLHSRGITSSPPGCPTDVPPALQPVLQYWIAATSSRQGRHPVDPKSAPTVPYIMEMAAVLGHPLQQLPVYVFSPLTLSGESLRCALQSRDQLTAVHVSDMASLGSTTSARVGDALALCAAEVIGAAILTRDLVGLPVHWSLRLCPLDLRSMAMVLGSPEDLLLQLANAEVNAHFQGVPWNPAASSLHTAAKLPGAQACTEKTSAMTTGALLGARRFGTAGSLSLDEVFSPEQLLYDLEARDHVERLVRGLDGDCSAERCLAEVTEGLEQKTFAGLHSTLSTHRNLYWQPGLYERSFLSAWAEDGARTIRQRAREMIADLLGQYDYELEPERRAELDSILARARRELGDC